MVCKFVSIKMFLKINEKLMRGEGGKEGLRKREEIKIRKYYFYTSDNQN